MRHYHRIGLLPEPPRHPNGHRSYSLRDAVELARIRRLVELGLSLDEVRDVVADDAGSELAEVLAELDADLARQEEATRQRRARLAQLLGQVEEGGGLPAESPVSPALTTLFDEMARVSARLPGPEPAMAAKERELLALLETATPDGTDQGWLDGLMGALGSDPEAVARAYEVYARFDELAQAPEDDPRVEATTRAVVDFLPPEVIAHLGPTREWEPEAVGGFATALFADLAPAQAAAVRGAIRLLQERVR